MIHLSTITLNPSGTGRGPWRRRGFHSWISATGIAWCAATRNSRCLGSRIRRHSRMWRIHSSSAMVTIRLSVCPADSISSFFADECTPQLRVVVHGQ